MEKRKACGHSFPSEIEYDEPHTLKALKEGTPSYRGFFLFWATEMVRRFPERFRDKFLYLSAFGSLNF